MATAIPDENLFSILTDDCIFELFQRLPLSDLCLCSRTCKRLQVLAENYFRRKFQYKANTEVAVYVGENGKVTASTEDDYIKYFGKFVKNLKIAFCISRDNYEPNYYDSDYSQGYDVVKRVKHTNMSPILNFIKNKCDENLHRICIQGNLPLDPLGKKIKKYLRRVEIVEFTDRNVTDHDETTFLKYCPDATKLILECMSQTKDRNVVFKHEYRKLKDFYYINARLIDRSAKELKTFFQLNENIKTVALSFRYSDDVRHAIECIQTVNYAINLEHLSLTICRILAEDFSSICNYLNLLCDRHNFQCLELEFRGATGSDALETHANRLAYLKQLTKIHLNRLQFIELIPALRSLHYLRVIFLNLALGYKLNDSFDLNDNFDLNDAVGVVDNLKNVDVPHIVEVHLVDSDDDQVCFYVMLFVRYWRQLQRIFLPAIMHPGRTLHVSILDRERQKLKDACELTIFTNHKGNLTNLDHRLVKLKRVEFESACSTKDATAFQRYYMRS